MELYEKQSVHDMFKKGRQDSQWEQNTLSKISGQSDHLLSDVLEAWVRWKAHGP